MDKKNKGGREGVTRHRAPYSPSARANPQSELRNTTARGANRKGPGPRTPNLTPKYGKGEVAPKVNSSQEAGNGDKLNLQHVLNSPETAVMLIDFQPDFLDGGALAVPSADFSTYVPAVQEFMDRCRAQNKIYIIQSQVWRPEDHTSFASCTNAPPFSTIQLVRPDGSTKDQMLWPNHCVQRTPGAKLLIEPRNGEYVLRKGTNKLADSISVFFDVNGVSSNFAQHLQKKGIKTLIGFGAAGDFAVGFSLIDAAKCGFNAIMVSDLCRSVNPNANLQEFAKYRIQSVTSEECYAVLPKLIVSPRAAPVENPRKVSLEMALSSKQTALLLIDLQYDFVEGGALAVSNADNAKYVPAVRQFVDRCRTQKKLYITQTQTCYAPGHAIFASSNNVPTFSTAQRTLPSGKKYTQVMWPDHCVHGTHGAKLLIEPQEGEFVQQIGSNKHVASYSAFFDVASKSTNFASHLKQKGIRNVIILGVTGDLCVQFSMGDAVKSGFNTFVVSDLCQSFSPKYDIAKEHKSVQCVTSSECYAVIAAERKGAPTGRREHPARPASAPQKQGGVDLAVVFSSKLTAVLIVNFQYDFLDAGALAVPNADSVKYVPAVRQFVDRCRAAKKMYITQSQSWYAPGHASFASAHSVQPFSTGKLTLPNGSKYDQILWPDHCVQGTHGAKFLIEPREGEFVQQIGTNMYVAGRSAFFDAARKNTDYTEHVKKKGIKNIIIFGPAGDLFVHYSVIDAIKCGFNTFVVPDLCGTRNAKFDLSKESKLATCVPSEVCYAFM